MMANTEKIDNTHQNAEWMTSDKALDLIFDTEENNRVLSVDGFQLMKKGKRGKGKNQMDMKTVYEADKGYCTWVRQHIALTSSTELQRLKVCIALRDQAKRDRLKLQQMGRTQRPRPKRRPGWGIPRPVLERRATATWSGNTWRCRDVDRSWS